MNALTNFSLLNANSIATVRDWKGVCIDNRTNGNIFFDVDIKPLSDFLNNGMNTNGEQVVYDVEQNHLISVHGKDYRLVKNEDAYNACNEVINNLGNAGIINVDDMFIKDAVVCKGGKTIRQYIFPNEQVTMPNGDIVLLRLVVVNSYDGSTGFQVQAGGFRIVCTNGLVTGSKFMSLNMRHTGSVQLEGVQKALTNSVNSFSHMGEFWTQMINTKIEQKRVNSLLADFCTEGKEVQMNKFMALSDQYTEHSKDLGSNYWALYNTLTAFSTHYGVSDKNAHNLEHVRLQREAQVNKLLRHKDWEVKIAA